MHEIIDTFQLKFHLAALKFGFRLLYLWVFAPCVSHFSSPQHLLSLFPLLAFFNCSPALLLRIAGSAFCEVVDTRITGKGVSRTVDAVGVTSLVGGVGVQLQLQTQ